MPDITVIRPRPTSLSRSATSGAWSSLSRTTGFWDVRRWKIGDATQRRIHGVEITRTGSEYTFRRKVCEQRTWADRMYLYPIPQSELYKNPNLAPQNTGW